MQHQLGEGGIEAGVFEGDRLGAALTDVDPWVAGRVAATNGSDGSSAATADAPNRRTSAVVSAPGPQPTSRTDWPVVTPAASANWSASGRA